MFLAISSRRRNVVWKLRPIIEESFLPSEEGQEKGVEQEGQKEGQKEEEQE